MYFFLTNSILQHTEHTVKTTKINVTRNHKEPIYRLQWKTSVNKIFLKIGCSESNYNPNVNDDILIIIFSYCFEILKFSNRKKHPIDAIYTEK